MTAVVLVPFDESKPVSTQKLSWDDGRTLQDNIQSLLGDTFYLQTPLFRPQNDRAGLFAYYNVPEQDQREGKQNVRTTRLAMSCGLFSLRFWGDVVLVRSFGGRWEDLEVKSIYGACCISSDLRMEIQTQVGCQLGVNNEIVPIPDWLGDAARQNYHDSAALARLANVMNISNNDQNDDNEEEEDDDDDKKSDADMDEKEETAPAENIVMQEEQSKVFVANSSLCLHCRGLSSSLCPDCEGAHFCDTPRSCRQTGWSHSCLCATWKAYTNHRKDISTFEWLGDWHQELTGRNCQMQTLPYEEFLAKLDINRECSSWWRTEMDGWAGGESQSATMVDASIRRSYIEGFAPIPIIAIPPQRRVTSQDLERAALDETNSLGLTILKSWKDYYSLRGIPSTSPVALLCTFPLTIYQAIVQYGEVPSTVAQMLKRPLRIHVVGAEKEMNFLDLFQEVGFLLPEDFQVRCQSKMSRGFSKCFEIAHHLNKILCRSNSFLSYERTCFHPNVVAAPRIAASL
jgi:hypothetical protein